MTNGTITKAILKAAQTEQGEVLLYTASRLMRQFPLSSEKLLYASDEKKVPAEAWPVLLQAAIETDREKLAQVNTLLVEAGLKPDSAYGRYVAPKVKGKGRRK